MALARETKEDEKSINSPRSPHVLTDNIKLDIPSWESTY